MRYKRKYSPSKSDKVEFAKKMREIEVFCFENGISQSSNGDSYYFSLDGKKYRVSNHSIEASNKGAFRENEYGEVVKVRKFYHPEEREEDVIYIHASKTRIVEIYNDLKAGYKLDSRGRRI